MQKSLFPSAGYKNIFFHFIIWTGLPSLIICAALIVIIIFNFSSSKTVLEENASNLLSIIAKTSNKKIETIVDTTAMIKSNPILNAALSDPEVEFSNDVSAELSALQNIHQFLDNICIINQNNSVVCDVDGVYSIDHYFNQKYITQNYNVSYWQNFKFYNTTDYRILSPTNVLIGDNKKVVIPIIFRRTENFSMKNLIIYYLDMKQFVDYSIENNMDVTPDIYLLNRYTNEIFPSSGMTLAKNYFPENFIAILLATPNTTFDFHLPTGNMMVTSYSTWNTLTGYSYFSLLNKNVIVKQLMPTILISIAIVILFILIAFVLVFRNTKHLSAPINEIYNVLSVNSIREDSGNILSDMVMRIHDVAKDVKDLRITLPCAQEKYLIDYLNATEYYIDENTRDTIEKTMNFPNEYFMIVILQLSPTFQLFHQYNSTEYENIQIGFYSIVKELFGAEFPVYVLPGNRDALYIICNLTNPDDAEKSDQILNEINGLLTNDWNFVTLSIGKSKPYKGIEGLKLAHKEASDNLTLCSPNQNCILLDIQEKREYDFGYREESDLFTALLSMNKKKIYELLNIIFERNKSKSNQAQKQLYTSIMNITLNAINMKSLSLPNQKTAEEIMHEFAKLPMHDTKKFVLFYIDYLIDTGEPSEQQKNTTTEIGHAIIDYIEKNYTFPGLSIDYLASYFHVSPAGISLSIKNTLGIGFHEYLTTLRVNKAKTLLLTTDDPVSDICTKCGFSSQQTFYRCFKKITGQTTTQIRNLKSPDLPVSDHETPCQ